MLLVIDNYDSFTFNLVQYFGELAAQHPLAQDLRVERNDALSVAQIRDLRPDAILLSPGPGDPDQAGVCLDVLKELSPSIPTLGVCLGHQAVGQVFGGKIVAAKQLMHGKVDQIEHAGRGLFAGLSSPIEATRYHSLVIDPASVPDVFEVDAWAFAPDGSKEIMAIRHREMPVYGVQFHPESFLTVNGYELLRSFLGATNNGLVS